MTAKKRTKPANQDMTAPQNESANPANTEVADIGSPSSVRNINADKQSETTLSASEKKFKDLVEMTTDWVWEVDKDGVYTYVSPKVKELLGYEAAEVLGKTPFDLMPEKEAERIGEFFREKVAKNEAFYQLENVNRHKTGHLVILETSGIPFFDEKGHLKGYRGIDRDITERKNAKDALRKSEEQFKDIFENTAVGMYRTAPDGRILMANPALVCMLGFSSFEQLSQRNLEEEGFEPCYARSAFKERIEKQGQIVGLESQWVRRDGTTLVIIENARVVRDESGKILYYEGTAEDITERKQAEQRIRELNEELEQRVRERTAELTEAHKKLLQEIDERRRVEKDILDISEREQRRIGQELHDSLGQQLTGIAIMSKVLEQRLKGKSIEESAEAQEIGRLLNQAAEQTRKLAKGLHPVDLDASGLMSALQELAVTTEQLFGIRCTFDCDEPVPIDDAAVAVHLYRIAQEAVTNAIKHSKAENIVLRLAPDRDMLTLTIESDGLDFPEVPPKNKGMGLHIMNYRAEMIDGTLDVHRGTEGGTIVTCAFADQRADENEKQDYGREKTAS